MLYRFKHNDIHIYISRIFKVLSKKLVSTVIISDIRIKISVFLFHFCSLYLRFHSSQWNMKLVSINFFKPNLRLPILRSVNNS